MSWLRRLKRCRWTWGTQWSMGEHRCRRRATEGGFCDEHVAAA